MEKAAGVRYRKLGTQATVVAKDAPILIRYADLCRIRHKSAYVDRRIMSTLWLEAVVVTLVVCGQSA
jgi:hypothetical protein